MRNLRVISRLDIKGPNLIKGIHLEGLRVLGDPREFARKYYEAGIDELIYIDAVASLYGRNSLSEIVSHTAQHVFVPLTVGGGIRSLEDVTEMLRSGADKVAINTAALRRPELITEVSQRFGSQCMVLSIEAKKNGEGRWEAFVDNGREHTQVDVVEWAKRGQELGAGEILLTSIDQEGTRKGFDRDLARTVCAAVSIPVIISGGLGTLDHASSIAQHAEVSAIAIADALHYNRFTVQEIKTEIQRAGFEVRIS